MNAIIKKFTALFTHELDIYVNAARVNDQYKRLKDCSKSTQVTMIRDLKLHYIIVGRRGADTGNILNIDINTNQFKATTMNVFVKMSQLSRHKELIKRIQAMPDINEEHVDIEIIPEENVQEDLASGALPIIQLEEHEKFKDVNDEVFDIEVRGERAKDKIYFKAKDVEHFFGMNRFIERLLRSDDSQYYNNKDYIILGLKKTPLRGIDQSCSKRTNHDHIYLTMTGLMRAVFVSNSGNDNLAKTLEWIVSLVYTHQFGSVDERHDLSKSLFKHILNDKFSGLYFIDLGPLNNLYDTMNISREDYPPELFGEHRIGKYGLSEDIPTRITQHKNRKSGYGRWSKSIDHKWSVLMLSSQLSEAEQTLGLLFKADDLSFEYTDSHKELILYPPSKESKIRSTYKKLLSLYPSRENELAQTIADDRERYQNAMELQTTKYQEKLTKAKSQLALQQEQAQSQLALIEEQSKSKLMEEQSKAKLMEEQAKTIEAKHQTELLELKLQFAEFRLSKAD